MHPAHYDLDQRLPAEALVAGNAVWSRYRQYPVFSRHWLFGRSVLICSIIALFAAFIGSIAVTSVHDVYRGLLIAIVLLAEFACITCFGPGLATWVRHRNLPTQRERLWICAAVVVGIAVSFPLDYAGTLAVDRLFKPGVSAHIGVSSTSDDKGLVYNSVFDVLTRLVASGLLGGCLALRAYFSEQRRWLEHRQAQDLSAARARAHEADLRLGMLQAQVEPHFLFNTLASIRVLIEQDPPRAAATLDALVNFLRATIPKLREQAAAHATLGQQLDVCRSYLELMQIRMGARLHYAIHVDAGLLGSAFPASILITLVENAIKHGIEPKPGTGLIEIRVRDQMEQLLVQVLDNGAGLKPGLGAGMGLANVREQLAHRFGTRANLRLHSLPDQRTCAEVSVPKQVAA